MNDYLDAINFKRNTLTLIASRIPEDQIVSLRNAFMKIDANGDGQLTPEELKAGIGSISNCMFKEQDFNRALKIMDTNNNGLIDYTEFIAACLHSYSYLKDHNLKVAFTYYDKDSSGFITPDELKVCLQGEDFTLSNE
jgi:calcium-dependent protein kinase